MIVRIEKPLVLMLHDRQIAEHGGSAGLRDENLLDPALARPRQLYAYGDPPPDLAALAASLAFGIAKNHAFVDGNKRTAFVAYRTFLALNDAVLEASAEAKYTTILGLAEGRITEADFAAWLREHTRLNPPAQVQEATAAYASPGKSRPMTAKRGPR
ncbi:type II toxin-antitoxin system death-on-curing family toxin [Solimonas soli]|uniref:type II toxin-antitoxin system death-on-curing family toxin n=1 Tax=Solimonas soli TaxID=413479 RepID=UPI0004883AA8|nr:type II toxin-antitoxin system death-on-curing family toxin [Solimonas soli]